MTYCHKLKCCFVLQCFILQKPIMQVLFCRQTNAISLGDDVNVMHFHFIDVNVMHLHFIIKIICFSSHGSYSKTVTHSTLAYMYNCLIFFEKD